jgi:hypothetical protein
MKSYRIKLAVLGEEISTIYTTWHHLKVICYIKALDMLMETSSNLVYWEWESK